MKYDKIVEYAKICKDNVEKRHKLGVTSKWAYYFARSIIDPKKDIPKTEFTTASSPSGNNFNKSVKKSEYVDMAKRLVKYVDKNKRLPNYITYGNYKVRVRDYAYLFADAVARKNPNTAKLNSDLFASPKKYGHSKKSGCDNMGQNTGYYCGVHSLQEVIRNLYNIVVPQSTLASWCGTTTSGTSHQGLETGVAVFNKKYNKNLKVAWKNFSDLGWKGIKEIVDSKDKDCIIHNLYRNQYGHYEVINDVSSNINVQNSLGNKCGSCYCGYIEYRTQAEFRSYINGISQKSIMVLTRG